MKEYPTKNKQQGLALLVLVIIILLVFITYTVSELSITDIKVKKEKNTLIALKKAKQALLNYAVLNVNNEPGYYGFLPCPDTGINAIPEGGAHSNCGSKKVNAIGLFPWASLETGVLSSYSGDCFWYAVSGEYKAVPAPPSIFSSRTEMLNEDSNGSFKVYDENGILKQGIAPEERVVAIVFNPSQPLTSQNRTIDSSSNCGLDYIPTEYLEGDGTYDNSSLTSGVLDIHEFINGGMSSDKRSPPFNDQLITITRSELWDAVTRRADFLDDTNSKINQLTEALAMCVASYGNNSGNRKLPRPANVNFFGQDYRLDSNYNDAITVQYLGRYPHSVNDSDLALSATYAPIDTVGIIFNKGFCNSLVVSGGTNINLDTTTNSENYVLWKNWKDHFIYAVSSFYAPDSTVDTAAPWCDGSNCIKVGGVEYAAAVIFSGSPIAGQSRNEPISGDVDTKALLANYIEVIDPSGGTGDYTPTGNDIVFCVTDTKPLTVVSCN